MRCARRCSWTAACLSRISSRDAPPAGGHVSPPRLRPTHQPARCRLRAEAGGWRSLISFALLLNNSRVLPTESRPRNWCLTHWLGRRRRVTRRLHSREWTRSRSRTRRSNGRRAAGSHQRHRLLATAAFGERTQRPRMQSLQRRRVLLSGASRVRTARPVRRVAAARHEWAAAGEPRAATRPQATRPPALAPLPSRAPPSSFRASPSSPVPFNPLSSRTRTWTRAHPAAPAVGPHAPASQSPRCNLAARLRSPIRTSSAHRSTRALRRISPAPTRTQTESGVWICGDLCSIVQAGGSSLNR